MQNQNTNNLSPWDEDLPEETTPPASPQVGTLQGPVTQAKPTTGAFTVPAAAAPVTAAPATPTTAQAPTTAPMNASAPTPAAPIAPAVSASVSDIPAQTPLVAPATPPSPFLATPATPVVNSIPSVVPVVAPADEVMSKFAAPLPAATPSAAPPAPLVNKFSAPQPTAPVAPAPVVPVAPVKKPKMGMKMKAILFGSLTFIIVLLGVGVVLTENGSMSIGFENVYGGMGLEKLWGGLPKDAGSAMGTSYVAMSNNPTFKIKGSLSMTVDSTVESEYTTPIVAMTDRNIALKDEDLALDVFNALLAVTCIGSCDPGNVFSTTLTATPSTPITVGQPVTLSWNSTSDSAVTCSAPWTTNTGGSGTQSVSPTTTTTYVITCKNSDGEPQTSASAAVTVNAAPVVQTVILTVNGGSAATVQVNTSATLAWSTTGSPATCTASGGTWGGVKGTSGTAPITPTTVGTTTYSIVCGTSAASSVTVTATAAPVVPVTTLTASAKSVAYNGQVTLTWSSNASSCTLNWGGTAANGKQTLTSLKLTKTYTATCSGKTASVEVAVGAAPAVVPGPTATLSADKTSIDYNGSVVLTWSSTNSTNCATSWTKLVTTSGTATLSALTSTTNYTISCSGAGGTKTSNAVTVTVAAPPPAVVAPTKPTATLSSDKTTAGYYDSVTLTWSSTDATTCAASWTLLTTPSGTETVITYGSDTTYNISCTGKGGTVTSNDVLVTMSTTVIEPTEPKVRIQEITADISGASSEAGIGVNLAVKNTTVTDMPTSTASVELKSVGQKVWVKSDNLLFDQAAVSDSWLEYNLSSLKDTSLAKLIFAQNAASRPVVKGVRVGNEKIDGIRCYHYTIDSLAIGSTLTSIGIKSDAAQTIKGEVWIGIKDKLIREIKLTITPSLSSSTTNVVATLKFSDFGVKNTISAPSVSEVISATGEMFTPVTSDSVVSGDTITSGETTTGSTTTSGTTVTTGSTTTGTTAATGSTAATGTTVVPQTSVQINDAQRKLDLASIKSALENYKSINGKYPIAASYVALNSTTNVVAKALVPKHLSALPTDPKTVSGWYYAYKSANGTAFTLSTKLENLVDPALTNVSGQSYYLVESTI
jgi:hypothetical protein